MSVTSFSEAHRSLVDRFCLTYSTIQVCRSCYFFASKNDTLFYLLNQFLVRHHDMSFTSVNDLHLFDRLKYGNLATIFVRLREEVLSATERQQRIPKRTLSHTPWW